MDYLIYTSRSTLADMPESALYHLISDCTARNKLRDVTSVLAYQNRVFIGYMEGEGKSLKILYRNIEIDPRHLLCRIIAEGEHDERWFPGVYMGFLSSDEPGLYEGLFNVELNYKQADTILDMFMYASKHPNIIENRIKHEVRHLGD